jgi:hypothetical protein
MVDLDEDESCECGGRVYSYVGFKMSLDLCYKCGKFHCKTDIKGDDFISFIEENSDLIPHLIKMKYLIPV